MSEQWCFSLRIYIHDLTEERKINDFLKRDHALTSGTIKAMLSGPSKNLKWMLLVFKCNIVLDLHYTIVGMFSAEKYSFDGIVGHTGDSQTLHGQFE